MKLALVILASVTLSNCRAVQSLAFSTSDFLGLPGNPPAWQTNNQPKPHAKP